jgi:hypothetical protein
MAGRIKAIIDEIIRQRSAANPMFAGMVKTKLILKGLDPSKFDANSPDDAGLILKVSQAAAEMGVVIK